MIDLKDSRILITGGSGFVGSYIVEQLLKESVQKIVIIDNFMRGSKENISDAMKSGRVELIIGDIRNIDLLNNHFPGIDYCFHLAALRITQCAAEPRTALEIMYDGSFNVIEACVKHQVKKIMFSSTASVYGQADTFPTTEEHHPYNNTTLYGASKTAVELMLKSFHQMRGLRFNATRYFNIYGPRMDVYGKYTEVLIRWYHLIKEGKAPLIYGDGKQTMDFVYIEDIARASILTLKTDHEQEIFNIASGEETSLLQLCEGLLKAMDSSVKPEFIDLPNDRKKVEVYRRKACTKKAKKLLGFETKVGLQDGLTRLVKWLDQKEVSNK